jgi:hypothetical protein
VALAEATEMLASYDWDYADGGFLWGDHIAVSLSPYPGGEPGTVTLLFTLTPNSCQREDLFGATLQLVGDDSMSVRTGIVGDGGQVRFASMPAIAYTATFMPAHAEMPIVIVQMPDGRIAANVTTSSWSHELGTFPIPEGEPGPRELTLTLSQRGGGDVSLTVTPYGWRTGDAEARIVITLAHPITDGAPGLDPWMQTGEKTLPFRSGRTEPVKVVVRPGGNLTSAQMTRLCNAFVGATIKIFDNGDLP